MKEPLYLPKGSVRAIIAIAVVGTCCYLAILAKPLPKEFIVITGMVVAFYFGTKKDKE